MYIYWKQQQGMTKAKSALVYTQPVLLVLIFKYIHLCLMLFSFSTNTLRLNCSPAVSKMLGIDIWYFLNT